MRSNEIPSFLDRLVLSGWDWYGGPVFALEASLRLMGGIAVVPNDKKCVDSLLIHGEHQIRVSMLDLCGTVQTKNMKNEILSSEKRYNNIHNLLLI